MKWALFLDPNIIVVVNIYVGKQAIEGHDLENLQEDQMKPVVKIERLGVEKCKSQLKVELPSNLGRANIDVVLTYYKEGNSVQHIICYMLH